MGEEADEKLRAAAADHIAHCRDCAQFQTSLSKMRGMEPSSIPELPGQLEASTRFSAHTQLRHKRRPAKRQLKIFDIPLPVTAAAVILTGLTFYWIVSGTGEITVDGPLEVRTIVSLSIVAQNLLMLMLSPILLKNRKPLKTVKHL
jgi:hypothetical protein